MLRLGRRRHKDAVLPYSVEDEEDGHNDSAKEHGGRDSAAGSHRNIPGAQRSETLVEKFYTGIGTSSASPRDLELGDTAVYDEAAWLNGDLIEDKLLQREDYVPVSLARERLQEAVDDMDLMKTEHLAMVMEVRAHYETILREAKRLYHAHSAAAGETYRSNVAKLKARASGARARCKKLESEVENLRQQIDASSNTRPLPVAAVSAVTGTASERVQALEIELEEKALQINHLTEQLRDHDVPDVDWDVVHTAITQPPKQHMQQAVDKVLLQLMRAQLNAQLQQTGVAAIRVEAAQQQVQAHQAALRAQHVAAEKGLREAERGADQTQTQPAMADGQPDNSLNAGGSTAITAANAVIATRRLQTARASLTEVETALTAADMHDADLERQRLSLQAERSRICSRW